MFLRYRGNIDIGTYRAQILLSELSAIGGLLVSPDMIVAIHAVFGLRPFYFPDNTAVRGVAPLSTARLDWLPAYRFSHDLFSSADLAAGVAESA
jgi:hypothetical protein